MRRFRPVFVTALSALALAASPALAHEGHWQDGPPPPSENAGPGPGPSWQAGPPPDHREYGEHGPMRREMRHDLPPRPGERRMGYGREEREGWLDECRDRLGGEHAADNCEAYLDRYEAAQGGGWYEGYDSGPRGYYGADYAGPGAPPPPGSDCGQGCGYPMMPPPGMMWVPVILPAQNCGCPPKPKVRTIVTEEVVPEKVVTYERVPVKTVRTRYTKYTKTVPVKSTKSTKSIK